MELENLIIKMDLLKEELDRLRPIREDRLSRLNQKLKLDWNYHSNSIEGNTLSMSETKSFLLWGVTAKGKPFRDYVEMKGHNEALNKLYQIINHELTITETLIKEFHKIILVEPYTDSEAEINPGNWKTLPNYLYSPTGERIDFAPPEDVPKLMNSLINWLNNHIDPPKRKKRKYDLHPLIVAAGFHAQFIKIHPFGDGNGRMARILTNLILMLCGYVPAIVKLNVREKYYASINTSSLDKPEDLAVFLAQAEIDSLTIAINAAKGEPVEDDDDFEKELELLNKKLTAKRIDVPLRSTDIILKLISKNVFPFFDELINGLSKFDQFFESVSTLIFLNNYAPNVPVEKRKQEILASVNKEMPENIYLEYGFNDISNVARQISIRCLLKFEFLKSKYMISDNISGQRIELLYDEELNANQKAEWVKKLQKGVLEKIKKEIDVL